MLKCILNNVSHGKIMNKTHEIVNKPVFYCSLYCCRIPYYFSASQQYPGKFLIAYMPRKASKYEYATVSPEGVRYRSKMFHSLNSLVRWFKEHFRDRVPGETMWRCCLCLLGSATCEVF